MDPASGSPEFSIPSSASSGQAVGTDCRAARLRFELREIKAAAAA